MHLTNNSLPRESLNSTLQKFTPPASNTLYRTSVSNREISVSHANFYDSFLINGKYKSPSQIDLLATPPSPEQTVALECLTRELADSLELSHRKTLEEATFHWILSQKAEFLLLNCSDLAFSSDENKAPRPPSAPQLKSSQRRRSVNKQFPWGRRKPTADASTRPVSVATTPKSPFPQPVTRSTQTAFECCNCSTHLQRCLAELSQEESERGALEAHIRSLEASQAAELVKVSEFWKQKCIDLHKSPSKEPLDNK